MSASNNYIVPSRHVIRDVILKEAEKVKQMVLSSYSSTYSSSHSSSHSHIYFELV
jgi:hypothetical protein